MKDSILRMIDLAGGYKYRMIISIFLAILSVGCGMIPFLIIPEIVMQFINNSYNITYLRNLAIAVGFALVLKNILFAYSTRASHKVAYKILYNTRIKLAYKLARIPLGFFTDKASGQVKKVMVEDVEDMERFLAHNLPETTSNFVIPLAVTIYLFTVDWRMAMAMLITIPLAIIPFRQMMKGSNEKMDKYTKAKENMNKTIVDYIKGIAVIKAFNQTTNAFSKYKKSIYDYEKFVLSWYKSAWIYMSAYFVMMTTNLIVIIPVGAYLNLNGSLSVADFILFLTISMGFTAPLIKLTEFLDGIIMVTESEKKVYDILKADELCYSNKISNIKNYSIEFKDVSFAYEQKDVIKNVSFFAESASTTAIVGPSGSGKSTLAKLIARFWDINKGEIRLGEVNIKEIPVETLMELVSFVFQDVFLFNVSIKENIRMGKLDASDEEIIKAAKQAQCHEFIMEKEKGYDTIVGESGSKLSGGEKQRISIARAILRNSPIIILDESTSSIDPENEDKIQEALNNLTKEKTVFIIAHRLSTIIYSDKILVINKGNIEDQGNHEELLSSCELYKQMWHTHIGAMEWEFELGGTK